MPSTAWDFFDTKTEFDAMTADTPTDSTSPSTNSGSSAANSSNTSPTTTAAATAAAIVAASTQGLAADTGVPSPSPDEQSHAPSFASFSSSQRTDIIANTTPRPPLQPIPEDQDSTTRIIGVSLSVANKSLDIHDLILYFLDTIQADAVYDYKQRHTSKISKQQLMHMMATPAEATRLYNNFFGVQDDIPRDRLGNKLQGRRYSAFYVSTTQSYKQMKDALWDRLGGGPQLMKLGWFLNPYDDIETVQKIVAIIQGKHPDNGYPQGYASRIRTCLKNHSEQNNFRLTISSHNDRNSRGDKVKAYGIQIGRNQAKDLVKALRDYPHKHFDGIYITYKADKKDFEAYDKVIDNIAQVPNAYTGIPIVNMDHQGATLLRQDLIAANLTSFPIDVEATHLHRIYGKYVVTCPVNKVEEFRTRIMTLLSNGDRYKSESFPDPPKIQTEQFKRKQPSSPVSSIAENHFGDLSTIAGDNSTIRTAPSYRELRQQALNSLPPPGPRRTNLFTEIPQEIDATPTSYANAAGADDASLGDSTLVSRISALTDENSRLQQSIQSRDETIVSMQKQLDEHVATSHQNAQELQQTKRQITELEDDLKQVRISHASQIKQLIEDHKQDVQTQEAKFQDHIQKQEQKHLQEVREIQDKAEQRHNESMKYFEEKFKAWTQQPPTTSTTSSSNKRSRKTETAEDDPDMDHFDEDAIIHDESLDDVSPSQQLQNLSLATDNKTPAHHAS